jgi:dehydrogenase/reductase SDR family member 1
MDGVGERALVTDGPEHVAPAGHRRGDGRCRDRGGRPRRRGALRPRGRHPDRGPGERIGAESGRLDLLVNNAWGGYERLNAGAWAEWNAPFWEQPLELWDAMQERGVRAHYAVTALLAPLLVGTGGGLVVTVSSEAGRRHAPHFNVAYSVAKAADDRLTEAMDAQLAGHGVRCVALYPGLVRTEGVMQFAANLDLTASEAPEGVGRVVAALAADSGAGESGGHVLEVGELAARYGVDVRS